MEAFEAAMAALASGNVPSAPRTVPLSYVMPSEALLEAAKDPAVRARLLPLLPEGQRDEENLKEIVSHEGGCVAIR